MIACRSASLIAPQRAISSSVRPQPMHTPSAAAIVQIFVQGETIAMPSPMPEGDALQWRSRFLQEFRLRRARDRENVR
jgi:hypothetical protein